MCDSSHTHHTEASRSCVTPGSNCATKQSPSKWSPNTACCPLACICTICTQVLCHLTRGVPCVVGYLRQKRVFHYHEKLVFPSRHLPGNFVVSVRFLSSESLAGSLVLQAPLQCLTSGSENGSMYSGVWSSSRIKLVYPAKTQSNISSWA